MCFWVLEAMKLPIFLEASMTAIPSSVLGDLTCRLNAALSLATPATPTVDLS
jgi:hypothetical protein